MEAAEILMDPTINAKKLVGLLHTLLKSIFRQNQFDYSMPYWLSVNPDFWDEANLVKNGCNAVRFCCKTISELFFVRFILFTILQGDLNPY